MTSTQIAEINAQHRERVRLLEMERDEKIRMVQEQCEHEPPSDYDREFYGNCCKHCGATLE